MLGWGTFFLTLFWVGFTLQFPGFGDFSWFFVLSKVSLINLWAGKFFLALWETSLFYFILLHPLKVLSWLKPLSWTPAAHVSHKLCPSPSYWHDYSKGIIRNFFGLWGKLKISPKVSFFSSLMPFFHTFTISIFSLIKNIKDSIYYNLRI